MEIPMRKRSLVVYLVFALALVMFLTIPPSFAGGPCGCYCGIYLPAPCSDDACKRACGWKGPTGGGGPSYPAYDAEAERQRQIEAERQRIEAEQRRQQEIQEQKRKDEADAKLRQEKFEQDKHNALNSMKGIADGELGLKDVGAGGLGLKDLGGDTGNNDLGLKEVGDKAVSGGLKDALADKPNRKTAQEKLDVSSITLPATKKALNSMTVPQIEELSRRFQAVEPPPPVSTDQISVRLRPRDKMSELILMGTEVGVALMDVRQLRIAGEAFGVVPKALLVTGKTFIAMENGADVYLVKQNEVYEQSLRWLKDKNTSKTFSETVQALRENRQLPSGATPKMVNTAKAILDPELGNSGRRIAWDAMWSPEAKAAGIKKACIEIGSFLIGKGAEGYANKYLAEREPFYKETLASLEFGEKGLKNATDPASKKAWEKIIANAGGMMGKTYRSAIEEVKETSSIASGQTWEQVLEKYDDKEKKP
jgi:hypothetical protein